MKRTIDMHGKRFAEAEETFHELLNESRMKAVSLEVTFITGQGVIQSRLMEMAESESLEHYTQMGNAGVLVIEFE